MLASITSGPVVSGGLLFGVATAVDGSLRAFNTAGTTPGSPAFAFATGSVNSQVAIGADPTTPVYYFTDGKGELNAISRTGSTAAAALAAGWNAAFTGPATITGAVAQPTLAADGTLYFGTDNGTIYAIGTDSVNGGVVPGATNWPRIGFDNCNSNNSSLQNCQ
jgi:outer membrane protein assembly factor BamB